MMVLPGTVSISKEEKVAETNKKPESSFSFPRFSQRFTLDMNSNWNGGKKKLKTIIQFTIKKIKKNLLG